MKHLPSLPCLVAGVVWLATLTPAGRAESAGRSFAPIPLAELGAKAGAQYQGDGLSVAPTPEGARLRCVFQKLEGQVTREGLWLVSTVEPKTGEKFRVVARAVGREGALTTLPPHGTVTVAEKLARCVRPGLTEEYSVSVDGVRQDFVVMQRPAGDGPLRVELDVAGARAEALVNGARLVLDGSGRKIAYSRLHVVDAGGNTLTARMEVTAETRLAVLVEDAAATYPVRIDPTFSDANWISMGGLPGANGTVNAAVVDGSGNLYIGGNFTIVGEVLANHVAKWNGSAWSALGSGIDGWVGALAASGSDLYVGGNFDTAGGAAANYIAKWDGSAWSALGSGLSGGTVTAVYALAVSGTDLYAGGDFTTAGSGGANYVAKWNGSAWSALGSGVSGTVEALAVSGGDLYVGGGFLLAGGSSANGVAKWNGSTWSNLGTGMDYWVLTLAVSGSNLYVGGGFRTAGGNGANYMAKWNGSAWSALGTGFNGRVEALAVSGSDLYVGGDFTTAGDSSANQVAKWNGSNWSPLGSGVDHEVMALAVSGSDLYVGGGFTVAGGAAANYIAKWNGSAWSALGSGPFGPGMDEPVYALAVSGTNLYAGGRFVSAGDLSANYVAKWDGSSWSPLGDGMDDDVDALAVSGTDLYAGGYFTMAGAAAANHVVKWNGTAWSALGSGVSVGTSSSVLPSVFALAVSGGDLYVGGRFLLAGGKVSAFLAKANLGGATPVGPVFTSILPNPSGTQALLTFTTDPGASLDLLSSTNLTTWQTNTTVNAVGVTNSVSVNITQPHEFFRLLRLP